MRTDEMLDMAFEIELTNRVEAKLVKLENSFPVIPVESSPKLFLFNMNNYSQQSESAEVADWQIDRDDVKFTLNRASRLSTSISPIMKASANP